MSTERFLDHAPSEQRINELVRDQLGYGVEEIRVIPDGGAAVYLLRTGGQLRPNRVVLKYCLSENYGRFLIEPRLIDYIDDETDVPVPSVYATGFDGETPYLLMEYCAGDSNENDLSAFSPEVQRQLAEEAGSYLAQVHAARTFDNHGVLTTVDGSVVPGEPFETPTGFFLDYLRKLWDSLPDAFDDLELRKPVEAATRKLPRMTPVLTHNDYSVKNLVLDPDEYRTNTVLDWETAMAAPAAFELAKTEALLCWYGPLDSPLRRRIREGLVAGYGNLPEAYREYRETLLLINRIGAMRLLPKWHGDKSPRERAKTADTHARVVRQLL